MALVGIELETLVSGPDALTTTRPPFANKNLFRLTSLYSLQYDRIVIS